MNLPVVLAHGSGIDDVLWFAVPVVAAIALLRLAERRARRNAERSEGESSDHTDLEEHDDLGSP
jgi:hypothetical protein